MPFFLFHFFVTCLGTAHPRANRPEVPCRIPECSGKALWGQEVHGDRVCPCPQAASLLCGRQKVWHAKAEASRLFARSVYFQAQ